MEKSSRGGWIISISTLESQRCIFVDMLSTLNSLVEYLDEYQLDRVTPFIIEKLRIQRKEKGRVRDGTVNDDVATLEGRSRREIESLRKQATGALRGIEKEIEKHNRLHGPDRLLKEETRIIGIFSEKRRAVGITQVDVAKRMGTQKAAVSRLESATRKDKNSPSLATLIKYADAIGCCMRIKLTPIK